MYYKCMINKLQMYYDIKYYFISLYYHLKRKRAMQRCNSPEIGWSKGNEAHVEIFEPFSFKHFRLLFLIKPTYY